MEKVAFGNVSMPDLRLAAPNRRSSRVDQRRCPVLRITSDPLHSSYTEMSADVKSRSAKILSCGEQLRRPSPFRGKWVAPVHFRSLDVEERSRVATCCDWSCYDASFEIIPFSGSD